ncbi:MAG: hypothetical protein ACT4N2_12920 [Hyphomicrobium sp.]
MSARKRWGPLVLIAAVLAGYAAYDRFAAPRVGRVLDFKVIAADDNGPAKAWTVIAEVPVDAGTPDDYAATAVAIAGALPADDVVVSIERSDVPSSAGTWRRTLARAEYRQTDNPAWTVSTAETPLSKAEIAAAMEYSDRVGLALTSEGEPLTSDMDEALSKELAAKYGVSPHRVMTFTRLHRERGPRWGWKAIDGPGSQHLDALAHCYANAARDSGGWKQCR